MIKKTNEGAARGPGSRDGMMKKMLYCNLSDKKTVEGHRQFDVKFARLLASFAEVTLLEPEKGWYEYPGHGIKLETYDAEARAAQKKSLNCPIWNKGMFRHLAIKSHAANLMIIRYIAALDEASHFDFIIVSAMDIIAFSWISGRITGLDRYYLIQHQCSAYEKKTWEFFFNRFKDNIHHIVMESDGVEYLCKRYRIPERLVHHIPHMLNPVKGLSSALAMKYDVVGISNSNDDAQIQRIIEAEQERQFFKKYGISAIFRSKTLDYRDDYLYVFAGRLGLSFEEYYGYISNAGVIILPFGTGFGLRSSGTIQDAFSQRIPIIGSPFPTMLQYRRDMPHTCLTYSSQEELEAMIIEVLGRDRKYEDEFERFRFLHSDEMIISRMKEIFG